jgi:hypothetical protein
MRIVARLHTITRSTAQFFAALPSIDIPGGQSFDSPVSQPATVRMALPPRASAASENIKTSQPLG